MWMSQPLEFYCVLYYRCPAGFFGEVCGEGTPVCDLANPCVNGGTCQSDGSCDCTPGNNAILSVQRPKGPSGYCFKYIGRPFYLLPMTSSKQTWYKQYSSPNSNVSASSVLVLSYWYQCLPSIWSFLCCILNGINSVGLKQVCHLAIFIWPSANITEVWAHKQLN